jgi:hypothetical protein
LLLFSSCFIAQPETPHLGICNGRLTFFANIPEYSMRISLAQFVDMDDISLLMQSPSARMFQVLSCLITYLVTVCARARLVQGLFNYFQIADVVSVPRVTISPAGFPLSIFGLVDNNG